MEVIRDSTTDRTKGCNYYVDTFRDVIICISFISHSCWTLHEPRDMYEFYLLKYPAVSLPRWGLVGI